MTPDVGNERTLPHSLEAERAVLGSILVHNDALDAIGAVLSPAQFFRESHRLIYAAMQQLHSRGVQIDYITLTEELGRRGELERCGGPAYISTLGHGVPRSTNAKYYTEIVRQKAALRAIIVQGQAMLTAAYAGEDSVEQILSQADRTIVELQSGYVGDRSSDMRQAATSLFADLEWRVQHRGELTGLETGFKSLNDLTFGWQPGDMIVVAARPSIGKSTFALNTLTAAARTGKRAAIFSFEMKKRQLEYRLISSLSGVALTRLMGGFLGQPDYDQLSPAFETLRSLPLVINDQGGVTVQEIRSACRRIRSDGGLDLVAVDYVQLIPGSLERRGATRTEELTDISRRLTTLADELSIPVLVLSQLKRLGGSKPTLEDLRDCGALEQDAAVVGLLHRKNHREGGATELILAKQRNGPCGATVLDLDRDTTTFTDGGAASEEPAEEQQQVRRKARARTFAARYAKREEA